ncbi:hypothetical protein B5E41_15125 [Rhizobium esperanzae]|uniref:Uncharacterized protein n=1 Tax=Rhizobium esperanzae TaxID=1967781 RepID=A0A246DUU5_9HYPH|nr:hypothetical protein B5E41_15125 [Rhizobium esperanzae]
MFGRCGVTRVRRLVCASEIPAFEKTLVDRLCGEVVDIGLAVIEELDGGAAQDLAAVFAHRDAEMAIPAHHSLRQASEILR